MLKLIRVWGIYKMWGQLRAAITPSSAHTTSNRLFLAAYHRFGVIYFIHSIGAFLCVPVAAIR